MEKCIIFLGGRNCLRGRCLVALEFLSEEGYSFLEDGRGSWIAPGTLQCLGKWDMLASMIPGPGQSWLLLASLLLPPSHGTLSKSSPCKDTCRGGEAHSMQQGTISSFPGGENWVHHFETPRWWTDLLRRQVEGESCLGEFHYIAQIINLSLDMRFLSNHEVGRMGWWGSPRAVPRPR